MKVRVMMTMYAGYPIHHKIGGLLKCLSPWVPVTCFIRTEEFFPDGSRVYRLASSTGVPDPKYAGPSGAPSSKRK